LNVNPESRQVTFKVIEKKNIVPPFLGWHWLQILKIINLLMVAFPAFLILIHNLKTNSHIHIIEGLASILGCFSLMIAVNLQNDYRDHLSGLDRLHPDSQSRVIQKGWVTAHQMKLGSYFYTIFGVLLGLPAIINEPQVLWAILGVLIFGSIGLLSFKMGLRYRRWSELSVFFLLAQVLIWI
jgi:1,4-dihydroxy-2-naphthoate octaprenyltransferase